MRRANEGRGLFMQSNGLPMVFHLPPGSTKKKLAPIIKQHGGEVTSRSLSNVICLADEKLWTSRLLSSSASCYWPTYILDCVEHQAPLDMELYRCSKGKRLMRTISIGDGEESTADEYDFAFGDDMAMTHSTWSKKGRMHYTKAEDMKMLKYLMDNGDYRRTKGMAVWTTMEKLQITPHSAQSMMARFRKVIVEQLDSYNIPDSWKTCLTGDLVRYAKDTRARGGGEKEPSENEVMDTLSKWIRTDRLSPQPSTSKAAQSRQGEPPTVADVRVSNDSLEEVEEEETDDSFDQNLLEMAHPGQQDVTDETRTVGVGEPVRSAYELSGAGKPATSAHEPSRSAGESVKGAHEPSGSAGELVKGAHAPHRSASEPRVNGAQTEHLSAKRRRVGRGESECEEGEGGVVLPLLSSAEKRLRRKLRERLKRPRRSPRKQSQKAAGSSTGSGEWGEEEEGGEEEVTEDTPPHRCQIPTRCASAGHATPSTSSTLLCPVTPPIYRDAVLSASSHSETGASLSPSRENEKCERHKEKKTKRMTALGVIRTLSEEFDLTLKEAQALFWRNGGHVNATRYWIMTGHTLPGQHYWSPEEDRVLLTREPDHPHWQRVEGLHGLTAILHRIQWLQADQ